jgi:hypothetical protein
LTTKQPLDLVRWKWDSEDKPSVYKKLLGYVVRTLVKRYAQKLLQWADPPYDQFNPHGKLHGDILSRPIPMPSPHNKNRENIYVYHQLELVNDKPIVKIQKINGDVLQAWQMKSWQEPEPEPVKPERNWMAKRNGLGIG